VLRPILKEAKGAIVKVKQHADMIALLEGGNSFTAYPIVATLAVAE
jgi:hypothetical protein